MTCPAIVDTYLESFHGHMTNRSNYDDRRASCTLKISHRIKKIASHARRG